MACGNDGQLVFGGGKPAIDLACMFTLHLLEDFIYHAIPTSHIMEHTPPLLFNHLSLIILVL